MEQQRALCYHYKPKPKQLPKLKPVEERLNAPRLPFMSIRRLTHVPINVTIEVQDLVRCLLRNVPEDAAIDVHIKRRLVSKASYRHGLIKKSASILCYLLQCRLLGQGWISIFMGYWEITNQIIIFSCS
ncbi:hypothetical protein HPB52_002864 [Rhipicephalus sanguineus]|uniref:Uncharacterized protein n=1 Tax=Rhipicephalus sanguineus TaxID=34632 RepID=A0A9D4T6N1_RHISA|nr:hypothetical protein HPB52_002864 [Rhipicephalus sanguineus]